MSFGACEVNTSIKDAQIGDFENANKNIRKLKSPSQGGCIVFLCKDQKKYAPISWKSKKIHRVVKGTIAAETLALQEALETYYMIRAILLELNKKENGSGSFPIYCYTDNKSLLDSVHSTKTFEEKRLTVDVSIIREILEKKRLVQ